MKACAHKVLKLLDIMFYHLERNVKFNRFVFVDIGLESHDFLTELFNRLVIDHKAKVALVFCPRIFEIIDQTCNLAVDYSAFFFDCFFDFIAIIIDLFERNVDQPIFQNTESDEDKQNQNHARQFDPKRLRHSSTCPSGFVFKTSYF